MEQQSPRKMVGPNPQYSAIPEQKPNEQCAVGNRASGVHPACTQKLTQIWECGLQRTQQSVEPYLGNQSGKPEVHHIRRYSNQALLQQKREQAFMPH